MIRLFIENKEIELDNTVQVSITKQFEDLSNPTTIINDWSKTVSIPFTVNNNSIFGHIYNIDKAVVNGGSVGVYFNPLKKLSFRIDWDNTILMTGYAKLNEVKQVDGKGTYEITLFGQLGKIFQEMKKITFDTSTTETNYLIDGSKYVEEYISKDLIYDTWISPRQQYSKLYPKYFIPVPGSSPVKHPAYRVTDIIGFAPNNSFSEGFKYDSYQNEPNGSRKFTDALGSSFKNATGINPDTVIPNGMLPREIGEYRSYLQLPYIYWNKLFQIFQEKAEEITGYQFDLDYSWFNDANPYWHNLVYMLRPFNAKDGTMQENANYYTTNPYGGMGWYGAGTLTTHRTVNLCTYRTNATNVETVPMIDLSVNFNDGKWFTLDSPSINPIFKIHTLWKIWDGNGDSSSSNLNTNNALIVLVKAVGENGYEENIKYIVKHSGCSLTESNANTIIFDGSTKAGATELFSIDADFLVTKAKFGNSIRFRFESYWKNTNWCLTSNGSLVNFEPYDVYPSPNMTYVTLLDGIHRSFAYFDLNDLWNNDYNVFGEILKYCKIYRISISVDEVKKKIIFKPFCRLFENFTVQDFTDKVDKSKDFIITPITFENKYILFNYDENKTKMGEEYKTKFGVNYGEYRLLTDYNFNSETKNLFDKVNTSIINTDNILSWNNLVAHKIVYSFPNEISVYNKDKDNKQVDVFGAYFFHNGIRNFSTESGLNLPTVSISDDTAFQQANNTYMYTQGAGGLKEVSVYPSLDIVMDDYICLFNVPSENYTYLNNYSDKKSIYTNFWKRYIDERYNIQNKKITCYMDISPSEYNQFAWNKLMKIDNQLCMVNKIYDYDITSTYPTKVDLITIQDINGYTDDTFGADIDDLVLHFYPTSYLNGDIMSQPSNLGTFESVTDVTFANGTKSYSADGVNFIISGNTVYYQTTTKYVDKEDANIDFVLKNKHHAEAIHCVRYSVYPYPEIKLYESDGTTERNTIYPGSRNYKLAWYGTETDGLENKPTVTIENHGTGSAVIDANTWVENQVMIQEGDDEWFRTEYMVNFNTNMTNYSGTYIQVTMVDKEGWHETKQFPVSTDGVTMYTMNSDGNARKDEDSVDYHGTSSTRGYQIYSNSSWEATLPQGVRSYGPITGDAGVTLITFDWGSGEPNTSKTITFNNTNGDTCTLVCHYVVQ